MPSLSSQEFLDQLENIKQNRIGNDPTTLFEQPREESPDAAMSLKLKRFQMNMKKSLATGRQRSPKDELTQKQKLLLRMQHNNYLFTEQES